MAGGFEGKEPLAASGHAPAAAGAALPVDLQGEMVCLHSTGLEGELKLFPGAALDLGPGVIAGTGRDQHRRGLLAGPAAGEAEFVVGGLIFHG